MLKLQNPEQLNTYDDVQLPPAIGDLPILQQEIVRSDAVGIRKDGVGAVAHGLSPTMVTKIAIFDAHHHIT